jgi:hypothetical protein
VQLFTAGNFETLHDVLSNNLMSAGLGLHCSFFPPECSNQLWGLLSLLSFPVVKAAAADHWYRGYEYVEPVSSSIRLQDVAQAQGQLSFVPYIFVLFVSILFHRLSFPGVSYN